MSIRDQIGKIIFGAEAKLPAEAPKEIRLRMLPRIWPVTLETVLLPAFCADCREQVDSTEDALRHRRFGHHVLSTAQGYISFLRRVLDQNGDYHRRILDLEHLHSEALEEIRRLQDDKDLA